MVSLVGVFPVALVVRAGAAIPVEARAVCAICQRFRHSRHEASEGPNTSTCRVAASPQRVTLRSLLMCVVERPRPVL